LLVSWLACSYLDLLLEILDVVDGQVQHVGGVGLLQGTGSEKKVSSLEWSSHGGSRQAEFAKRRTLFYRLVGAEQSIAGAGQGRQ